MNKVLVLVSLGLLVLACNQPSKVEEDVPKQDNQYTPNINYLGVSVSVAITTKKALGAELKAAMNRGGVEEAVNYCNLNALSLTDSIALRYNATIKRATDKPRNPQNAATAAELEYMEQFRLEIASDGKVNPVIVEKGDSIHFFAPIALEAFCLTCHGTKGKDITDENYAFINAKYPEDKAISYSADDLRGVWHISYPKLK